MQNKFPFSQENNDKLKFYHNSKTPAPEEVFSKKSLLPALVNINNLNLLITIIGY